MEILANLSFNFNFFQPQCSVSSPYWYTWLGLLGCKQGVERWAQVYHCAILYDGTDHNVLPRGALALISREPRGSAVSRSLGIQILQAYSLHV